MNTITQGANFAQATRKVKDREITYTWQSPSQTIQFGDELVGGLVRLSIAHDSDRKRFNEYNKFAHYDNSRGYQSVQFQLFDKVNYPHGTVAWQPIARYSAKALGEFESLVVEILNDTKLGLASALDPAVHEAWRRVTLIALGGDGTEQGA